VECDSRLDFKVPPTLLGDKSSNLVFYNGTRWSDLGPFSKAEKSLYPDKFPWNIQPLWAPTSEFSNPRENIHITEFFMVENKDEKESNACTLCGSGKNQNALFSLSYFDQRFWCWMEFWSGCKSYNIDDRESTLWLSKSIQELYFLLDPQQRKVIEEYQASLEPQLKQTQKEIEGAIGWNTFSSFLPIVDVILSFLTLQFAEGEKASIIYRQLWWS